MIKLKCYDKYRKQHLVIDFDNDGNDDRIYCDSRSSDTAIAHKFIYFNIDEEYYKQHPEESAEDPSPERWSDLECFEIIK